jgi:integrase
VRRLHGEGKIKALYSVHDLRHAFAKALYLKTRDIYKVSRALYHATVDVTARYLRSLGLADLK